jgi:hypothetical protein
MGPQSCGNWDSHFGVPRQLDIWVLVPWPHIECTIRGKVMASPKSGPWWILWICVCPWFVYAPKYSNYALTNLLFSLCRSMWVIDLLVNLLSPHPEAPAHPSTPKVLWAKECTPTLSPSIIFTFGLVVESIKELKRVSHTLFSKMWHAIIEHL